MLHGIIAAERTSADKGFGVIEVTATVPKTPSQWERPTRLRHRATYDRSLVMAVQTTKRRILIVVALLGAGILLFLAWLGGGPYTEAWPTKFDPDRWKAASATWTGPDAHEDNTRCGMLMDLRVRVGIAGKSRNELVKILGEPSGDQMREFWALCPSFMDHWILEVDWQHGRAANVTVRDT